MNRFKHYASISLVLGLLLMTCTLTLLAQTATSTDSVVPRLVNFSGKILDAQGKPLPGVAGVNFAIYKDQEGGAPLWMETQNIQADKTGHYTVQLGASKSTGLPSELFASGEARWLGAQVHDQAEQPRTLLLSVPYALKAADAETIGGLPPSAFVLAGKGAQAGTSAKSTIANAPAKNAAAAANPTVTGKGALDFIPMWDTAHDIVDSILFQKSSQVGVNTITPAATLDVNGKSDVRDTLTLFPRGTDPTLAINGTTFKVDQTGKMTFVSGQAFPGTGSVTSVALSAPNSDFNVTGSPVTKSGTLNLNWNVAPTSANTPNAIVKRNSGGGFSAGTIVANQVSAQFSVPGAIPIFGQNDTYIGVYGKSMAGTAGVYGVLGSGDPAFSYGVYGENDNASGGKGVMGYNPNGNQGFGVQGFAGGPNAIGVVGTNTPFGAVAQSIRGTAPMGVIGDSNGYGVVATSDKSNALLAENGGTNDTAVIISTGGGAPLYAASGPSNFMFVDANGNVVLSGLVFAAAKDFKIDHPLDPANKYLYHASVESSEMMNIYTGTALLDASGSAIVSMPDWFEAVNGDFRYQLTAIGTPGPNLHVAQEISNHQFAIAGGQPGMKVSWQVTGVRHDAFAKTHPLQVVAQKSENERGYYIHPDLYGAPAEKSLAALHTSQVRQPAASKQEIPAEHVKK